MKTVFAIFTISLCLIAVGKESSPLTHCSFTVIGKSYYSDFLKRNFAYGAKVKLESHIFSLPSEVDEVHCTAFKADLNADGKTDYVLQVAGTGNGRYFGACDIYIFVSCPENAKPGISFGHIKVSSLKEKFRYMHMDSYGISAVRSGSRILLKSTSLSEDCRTHIDHYYSFDKSGWMKETAVKLAVDPKAR